MPAPESSQWDSLRTAAQVWHVDPGRLPASDLENRCISWLTAQERERLAQFRTDRLRHDYLAARQLCRSTLSRYAGVDPQDWTFTANEHGKPAVAGPIEFADLRFNLTHTDGLVACIVSRAGEVGIDAEEIARKVDVEGIAANFFSEAERAALQHLTPNDRPRKFLEYWVVKEAYLKGCGTGLTRAPEGFTVGWEHDDQPRPIEDWRLSLHYATAHHVAAVAIRPWAQSAPIAIVWNALDPLRISV